MQIDQLERDQVDRGAEAVKKDANGRRRMGQGNAAEVKVDQGRGGSRERDWGAADERERVKPLKRVHCGKTADGRVGDIDDEPVEVRGKKRSEIKEAGAGKLHTDVEAGESLPDAG